MARAKRGRGLQIRCAEAWKSATVDLVAVLKERSSMTSTAPRAQSIVEHYGVLPAVVGLVDEQGGLRASLALNPENQAALTFQDDAGAVRMAAGVVNGQPKIAATSGDGSLQNWPE